MAETFKRGDRVSWNSEAGRVSGIMHKRITSEITFKGYKRHASKDQPQYIIKSDKTDHVAIHKGSALSKIAKKRASIEAIFDGDIRRHDIIFPPPIRRGGVGWGLPRARIAAPLR